MANCDVGILVSALCLVASAGTLLLGAVYLVLCLDHMDLRFEYCGSFEKDCNRHWRSVFTLNPCVMLDLWTPLVLGLVGCGVHVHSLRVAPLLERLTPTTFAQYGFFMFVTGLFANFGYCGQAGVILGGLSLLSALGCAVACAMGEKGVKAVQTKF